MRKNSQGFRLQKSILKIAKFRRGPTLGHIPRLNKDVWETGRHPKLLSHTYTISTKYYGIFNCFLSYYKNCKKLDHGKISPFSKSIFATETSENLLSYIRLESAIRQLPGTGVRFLGYLEMPKPEPGENRWKCDEFLTCILRLYFFKNIFVWNKRPILNLHQKLDRYRYNVI
jgi:hypothetical protein